MIISDRELVLKLILRLNALIFAEAIRPYALMEGTIVRTSAPIVTSLSQNKGVITSLIRSKNSVAIVRFL